jgi:L-amino acid N-acyltransferase YncA
MSVEPARHPLSVAFEGTTIEIARMVPTDGVALQSFIAGLPPHDLLFLRRDVSHPDVLAAWMSALRDGRVTGLVARQAGVPVGCTAIVTEAPTWQQHVGELRVLLLPTLRGKGLGQLLIQESFVLALGLGLEKLTARMTVDQRGAIAAFQGLGFRAEGLLHLHVKDREGKKHDLVLLGHDVASGQSLLHAYGITSVLDSQQEVA